MPTTLLICEGLDDAALVQAFIAFDLLSDDVAVTYVGERVSSSAGILGLQDYLEAIPALSEYRGIKRIGVLADNDLETPVGPTVRYVQNVFRQANANPDIAGRYSVPTSAHATFSNSRISTTLILLPGGSREGCLETLLSSVLDDLYPGEMACVEQFLSCAESIAPEIGWSGAKKDKARVTAALAVLRRARPHAPLHSLWRREPGIIPVTHASFRPLLAELAKI